VTATNAVGNGPPSAASTPVTLPTAPAAPAFITATAGIRSAALSWTAQSNGGSALTGYSVFQSLSGASYTPSTATISGTTAAVTGLTNGGSYSFEVLATNAVGNSVPSSPSNSITLADVPGAPTNAAAVAGPAQASVSWIASTSNGGKSINSYTVISSPGNISATTANGSTTTATVTGLTNGLVYTFTVVATSAVGNSAPSGASNAAIPASQGLTSSSAGKSCKDILAATPALVGSDGQYWINPSGSSSLQTFCDMTTNDGISAGGWTFFAYVAATDHAGSFFNIPGGTFSPTRNASSSGYSNGIMANLGSEVTTMMIVLGNGSVAFLEFPVGTASFQTGPLPCADPSSQVSFSSGSGYIGATFQPTAAGSTLYCGSSSFLPAYPGTNQIYSTTGFQGRGGGTWWGAGMGGDETSGHTSFWYAR
jgi:hypothetical protein